MAHVMNETKTLKLFILKVNMESKVIITNGLATKIINVFSPSLRAIFSIKLLNFIFFEKNGSTKMQEETITLSVI
ncbi:hypothetical protein GCM10027170_27220 [Aliiglaciecola aliphaticivorans]